MRQPLSRRASHPRGNAGGSRGIALADSGDIEHPSTAAVEAINPHTYGVGEVVDVYRQAEGYTDPGERLALDAVAGVCRGQPILDIGVGGGRTVPLLRAISADYRAIDYTAAMVSACKARFPGVEVARGDARDLEGFEDATMQLVVFSFNGIDSVGHGDRLAIVRSVYRVLRPGGVFLFSSHNRDGPVTASRGAIRPALPRVRNPLKLPVHALRFARSAAILLRNEVRYRRFDVWERDYALVFCAAHDHGLRIYHARPAFAVRQLREAGFAGDIHMFGSHGARVSKHDDLREVGYLHYVARK